MSVLLSLVKAEYEYTASNDEEITIAEDEILYVLENDDPEWWKVKAKAPAGEYDENAPAGLVPASYLVAVEPTKQVRSVYAYDPQTEEELAVDEDEEVYLYETSPDWVLVGKMTTQGVGYIPAAWIEEGQTESYADAEQEQEAYEAPAPPSPPPAPPAAPPAPAFLPPPTRTVAATPAPKPSGDVKTFTVSLLDKKKNKKKGTLGISAESIFFASESDKTPVQQYAITDIEDYTTEKSKNIVVTMRDGEVLSFHTGTKEMVGEIAEVLEDVRSSTVSRSTSVPRSAPAPAPASVQARPAVIQYDFTGEAEGELSVQEGEKVTLLDDKDEDWWSVRNTSGQEGLVPASYVEPDDGSAADSPPPQPARASSRNGADDQMRSDEEHARSLQAAERRAAREEADMRAMREAQGIRNVPFNPEEPRRKKENRQSDVPPPAPIPVPTPPNDERYVDRDEERRRERERRHAHKKSKDQTDSGRKSKPNPAKVRIWKDRTGQFKVEAEFLGIAEKKLRLHKTNGVIIEVPIEKMSADDLAYLFKVTGRQLGPGAPDADDTPLADVRKDKSRDERAARAQKQREAEKAEMEEAMKASAAESKPKKAKYDWFDFFLNAGCDIDDCTRYANNFDRDRIDEEVLVDLEASTLRSLGLREGDVIRVRKAIKSKYGSSSVDVQNDESLSKKAQEMDIAANNAAGGSLFTSPGGGLKTTRRGRPTTSRNQTAVSADALTAASDQLSSRGTPEPAGNSSPPSKRSSSTVPITNGFDDDAWTVKTTASAAPAAPAAPEPPSLLGSQAMARPSSAASSTAPQTSQDLTESILARMGVTNRPPSAPIQRQQATTPQPVSPQPSGPPLQYYDPNAPRGPVAPVHHNTPLLNPLIPTQTGFSGFVPTRAQGGFGAMQVQPTGFMGTQPSFQPASMAPMQTGFNPGMMVQQTGLPGMMSQATGMPGMMAQPTSMGMMPQQTGFQQNMMPQQTGMMPQQTGMYGGMQSNSPVPFQPQPPQQQAPQLQNQSTPVDKFTPGNVFATMKTGTLHQDPNAMSQPQQKYDALRPQQTGFAGFTQGPGQQQQPLTAQVTGFAPMSMSMPPQQQMPQFGQQMPVQMTGQMTGMNGMNGFQGYQQQPYRQF